VLNLNSSSPCYLNGIAPICHSNLALSRRVDRTSVLREAEAQNYQTKDKDNFSQHIYSYYKTNIFVYKMLHISTVKVHY
jgi:hypothetical protein